MPGVNYTEINGFEIDVFNQYDLKQGSKEGICPLCSLDRKPENRKAKCAMYDWERGLGTCMNCNEVFQLHTFKRKGGGEKEYFKPDYNPTELPDKVVDWFKGRGISASALLSLNVGYGVEYMPQVSANRNAIRFNYFIGDELINIKCRDGEKNFKLVKGAEKVFYNLNGLINSNVAIIVEGEMDVLALVESGIRHAVSVPNGAVIGHNNLDYLDNCIDYFADKEKIIIAVDSDEAGQTLKNELIRRLGAEICYTANFGEAKDANEALVRFGADFVRNAMVNAVPVPLEYVVTLNDINDELEDFVHNGFKPGYQIGLDNFDDIFSTYTGQFITVTGVPSSGKSDFVDRMVVGYNQKYGWKTAYASPENQPIFLHGHKLMRKVWGKMPSKEDIGGDKWNEVKQHVNDNFYFIDMETYDLDSVLSKGAELVKRKGIKCLVIDPYNKVRMKGASSLSIPDATLEYLSKIDIFCKRYDVLVFLVAHPRKMNRNEAGEIMEPNFYDVKGGGEFYDSSYHGLCVHRDYKAKTVSVRVMKVKFQNLGQNGEKATFVWDHQSGNYIPQETIEIESMPWE